MEDLMKTVPRKISLGKNVEKLFKETADAQDTLMGRLASRMASRDMIDELDLGPKGRTPTAKKAVVADNVPDKMHLEGPAKELTGAGLHQQTADKKASNFSNPIPEGKVTPGANMADQAKAQGNVYGKYPRLS